MEPNGLQLELPIEAHNEAVVRKRSLSDIFQSHVSNKTRLNANVSANNLSFGAVDPNIIQLEELKVANNWTDEALYLNLVIDGEAFSVMSNFRRQVILFNLTCNLIQTEGEKNELIINPKETLTLKIAFSPTEIKFYSGCLYLKAVGLQRKLCIKVSDDLLDFYTQR